jgi:hypothetical protein
MGPPAVENTARGTAAVVLNVGPVSQVPVAQMSINSDRLGAQSGGSGVDSGEEPAQVGRESEDCDSE